MRLFSYCGKFWNSLRARGIVKTAQSVFVVLRKCWVLRFEPKDPIPLNRFQDLITITKQYHATLLHPELLQAYNQSHTGRKVLVISHALDLTGAPIVLSYLIDEMKAMGDLPVLLSPTGGPLLDTMEKDPLPVILYPAVYQSSLVAHCANFFDLIVINTILGAPLIRQLTTIKTPIFWWIHEADASYEEEIRAELPRVLPSHVHLYCVSEYARDVLLRYRPNYTVDLLYYGIPLPKEQPEATAFSLPNSENKTVFLCVGTQEYRKGQDILVAAIRLLTTEERQKCLFVFVCRPLYYPIYQAIKSIYEEDPTGISYYPELNHEQLEALYQQSDCLVCPSRDDPLPCTITEMLQLGKIVISSNNTGHAPLLETMRSGFTYPADDPQLLAEKIREVLSHPESHKTMQKQALATYETYFSMEVFQKHIRTLLNQLFSLNEQA